MRIIAPFILVLISAIIIITSLELKTWSEGIASKDDQSFVKVKETRFDTSLWTEYLGHELDLNIVTSNIFEIGLERVSAGKLSSLLDKLENLRYVRLYKLGIIANQPDQVFKVSAVMTLD